MPGVHEPKNDLGRKRHFITEKIVRQPLTRRQIIKRFLALCFCAAVFGVIAAVSFVFTQPLAVRMLGTEETEESTISFPKDEPTEMTEATEPETETVSETEPESESEPVEELVQDAMERYHFTVDDLNKMFSSLRSQVQSVNKGIVVVHSVQQGTDWFDNPVETSGQYAGAVIARTAQELVIMTPEDAVERADSIQLFLKFVACTLEQFRVKWTTHFERNTTFCTSLRTRLRRCCHCLLLARDNNLSWTIIVCNCHDSFCLLADFQNFIAVQPEHCCHGASLWICFLHKDTALSNNIK